jgi:hypothetical protein
MMNLVRLYVLYERLLLFFAGCETDMYRSTIGPDQLERMGVTWALNNNNNNNNIAFCPKQVGVG